MIPAGSTHLHISSKSGGLRWLAKSISAFLLELIDCTSGSILGSSTNALAAAIAAQSMSMVGIRSLSASSSQPPTVSKHCLSATWRSPVAGSCTTQVILWPQSPTSRWNWSSQWRRLTAHTQKVVCVSTRCLYTQRGRVFSMGGWSGHRDETVDVEVTHIRMLERLQLVAWSYF